MRFTLPEQKKLSNELIITMRWGDMDAMRHVNNTVYFRYFEMARIDWFEKIRCAPNPRGEGPVIVNAFCNFIKQLSFPGDLLVRHYVGEAGRSSFDTYITIARCDAPDLICAEGGATVVWIDAIQQKSMPLPDWVRAAIAG